MTMGHIAAIVYILGVFATIAIHFFVTNKVSYYKLDPSERSKDAYFSFIEIPSGFALIMLTSVVGVMIQLVVIRNDLRKYREFLQLQAR